MTRSRKEEKTRGGEKRSLDWLRCAFLYLVFQFEDGFKAQRCKESSPDANKEVPESVGNQLVGKDQLQAVLYTKKHCNSQKGFDKLNEKRSFHSVANVLPF